MRYNTVLFSIFYFLVSSSAFAASSVFIETEPVMPAAGSEFIARVYVASDQPLNGYELVVSYDTTAAELVRTDTSGSLMSVWPKQPTVFAGGIVQWSGASIEPFTGERGELMALHFRANVDATVVAINMGRGTALYLANGKGTKISIPLQEFSVKLGPAGSGEELPRPNIQDGAPPEITFIAMEPDPITSGQKLIGFQTNDSGSGIAALEIRTRTWFFWSDWRQTRNPDALTAGVWEAELRITDYAGNVARQVIRDWPTAGAKAAMLLLVVALGVALVHGIRLYWLRHDE